MRTLILLPLIVLGIFVLDASAVAQTNQKKPKQDKNSKAPSYVIDHSIYRDRTPFPVDPRKPCSPCVRGDQGKPFAQLKLPGLHGRPYQDREPGGCLCGDRRCRRSNPFVSSKWPQPFSANREARTGEILDSRRPRITDCFDALADFKLLNHTRTDNGYQGTNCRGRDADRYGCLGQSKQFGRVAGVGFRQPGSTIDRSSKAVWGPSSAHTKTR